MILCNVLLGITALEVLNDGLDVRSLSGSCVFSEFEGSIDTAVFFGAINLRRVPVVAHFDMCFGGEIPLFECERSAGLSQLGTSLEMDVSSVRRNFDLPSGIDQMHVPTVIQSIVAVERLGEAENTADSQRTTDWAPV